MDRTVGSDFAREHLAELRRFLYEAQLKGYGGEEHRGRLVSEQADAGGRIERRYESGVRELVDPDGGTKIIWQKGDFRYSDKYFGGEPFGGMSVVRYKGKACFIMTYQGQVYADADKELVYGCLKRALMAAYPELPIRGPQNFVKSGEAEGVPDLEYSRAIDGDLTEFSGEEWICIPHQDALYEAIFMGGVVNLR